MTQPEGDWRLEQVLRVGAAIRAIRGRRSTNWLSDATAELGERVGRSTITDIEIGRRKYVALHEISVIAAALGVPPVALLTFGSMPDGPVEFLPNRTAPARQVAAWWGGIEPPRHALRGIPQPDDDTAKLFAATAWRDRLRASQLRQAIDQVPDPAVMAALREQIETVEATIRSLGGVLSSDADGHAEG